MIDNDSNHIVCFSHLDQSSVLRCGEDVAVIFICAEQILIDALGFNSDCNFLLNHFSPVNALTYSHFSSFNMYHNNSIRILAGTSRPPCIPVHP